MSEELRINQGGLIVTRPVQTDASNMSWDEMRLTEPFVEVAGPLKTGFSFRDQHFLSDFDIAEGETEVACYGNIKHPLVVRSSRGRGPLYIVMEHNEIIDVLDNEGISGPIGSLQMDQHLDLAPTVERGDIFSFECRFNAELIRRGIFDPKRMVILIPYFDEKPSGDDPELMKKVFIQRLKEQDDVGSILERIQEPFIFHLDLDMLRGRTDKGRGYTLDMCMLSAIKERARVVVLVTSPLHIYEFTKDEISDIDQLVQHW